MKIEIKDLKKPDSDISCLSTDVFIDYESLYWSFKQCNELPRLDEIVQDMKCNGRLRQIKVFGDFTKPEISKEKSKIRTVTNHIIDCSNESTTIKKDFTDFIMLDHIYQEIIQNKFTEQFIFFTGDGHFSSVATFMKTFMDKIIGVYGVQNSLSRQLTECSSWTRIVNILDDDEETYFENIIRCLKKAEEQGSIATFKTTVTYTIQYYGGNVERCEMVLRNMINEGYVISELCTSIHDREFKRLIINWDKVNERK